MKKTVVGKGGKKSTKTEYGVRHSLDREALIKRFGKEKVESLVRTDSHYKKYALPEFPAGTRWLWNHFYYIWRHCKRDINGNVEFSFFELNQYEKCMKVRFSIFEKKLLLKMKDWAMETIVQLENGETEGRTRNGSHKNRA